MSVLDDPTPLQPNYLSEKTVDREDEVKAVNAVLATPDDTGLGNLFVHGPRGTGKTHLTRLILNDLPSHIATCYISCTRWDTQYKVLQQLCRQVTDDTLEDGFHTSQLQRKFEQHCGHRRTVVVLDEIDCLLLNDGDSLLYSLCRMDHSDNIGIVAISANHSDLACRLEERTYSSLYPQRIEFEPYTAEHIYRILAERARKALTPHSLQQEALTYIASTTQNATLGLTWLKLAAENATDTITEQTVKQSQERAYQNYVDHLLQPLSEHHQRLYQAIYELTEEQEDSVIQSGAIYDRYQELCQSYSEDPLSDRRISDYLKHLELLQLITADYHYGGQKGKTREVKLAEL